MQYQKCNLDLYVNFLIGSQKQYSANELSKVSPKDMAHDSVSRWLSSQKLTPKTLWRESKEFVSLEEGYLVIDDSVLDKPYARVMPLVKKQYSGKHHGLVNGIDIVNFLWTNGEKMIPIDYRVYDPSNDGKTKNDHAKEMLETARSRGFKPKAVLMDSWFTSIGNLKLIENFGWKWIGGLKCNRLVSEEQGIYARVEHLDWTSKQVRKVWLKAYGFVQVSKIVATNGDVAYVASNDMSLDTYESIKTGSDFRWDIETFHRGIKQCCGIERCYSTLERSQRNHILCAFLAFLKLECKRVQNSISWYEQKWDIPRGAVRSYLANA